MTKKKMTAADIRTACAENPKMRARDLANQLGISEAEYVAAWCGSDVMRIDIDMDAIFGGLAQVGEVMALTRNESAVHESIGVFDNYHSGNRASMMLGDTIDTRMFPMHFKHSFMIRQSSDTGVKHSLQFFDAAGDAVHKIHLRDKSDITAWNTLLTPLISKDQSQIVDILPAAVKTIHENPTTVRDALHTRWSKMTDTHQFVMIIRKLGLSRLQAVEVIGADFAWQIAPTGIEVMLRLAAKEALPIMCFVGSRGCIQIHSGPVNNITPMGPWLNIMDQDFHLHLRTDHITQLWAVRKPTDTGHVTSIEAYNAEGELIIQFFGKRIEGQDERPIWREIIESLPPITQVAAE